MRRCNIFRAVAVHVGIFSSIVRGVSTQNAFMPLCGCSVFEAESVFLSNCMGKIALEHKGKIKL
jgi:hypothetical protein